MYNDTSRTREDSALSAASINALPNAQADLLDGVAPPRWADALVALAILLAAAGAGYALWADLQLIYDGSFQLGATLREGKAFVYLSRFHTWALWAPVAWLAPRSSDPHLLSMVYGLPFLAAPVLGLALSWWIVRRHRPGLIVWAALGICGTSLPGQVFVINDSLFQQHLFWPIFLGVLVRQTFAQKVVMAVLAVFQLAHPVGFILMTGATLAAGTLALATGNRIERRRLLDDAVFAGVFAAFAGWKLWWVQQPGTPYFDPYLAEEASWANAKVRWIAAVNGWPIKAVCCLYVAAAGLLLQAMIKRSSGGRTAAKVLGGVLAIAGVGAATAALWIWSDSMRLWWGAVDYRRWLVPLTLPMYAMIWVEQLVAARRAARPAPPPETPFEPDLSPLDTPPPRPVFPGLALRSAVVVLLAGMFAAVLGNQSRHYKSAIDRLYAELMASPAVTMEIPPQHFSRETALQHWSITWQLLMMQGRKPTKWLVATNFTDDAGYRPQIEQGLLGNPPRLPVHADVRGYGLIAPEPGGGGWFDFSELLPKAAAELRARQPAVAATPSTQSAVPPSTVPATTSPAE